jgi:phage-related protein
MVLFEILSSEFSVYAAGESQTGCDLRSFISGLASNLKGDGRGILALLKRIAQKGPILNPEISHKIEGNLFQLRQGRIRVLYFYDKGKIIICTHGFIKKSSKTPDTEKEQAKFVMKKYFEDKESGAIEKIPWNEGEENGEKVL